ncbi:hypothetical protein [Flavobacterium aestuarii]|uniref:hypothetical protein n=1 Tax=Flavobacterium aestuarii TaxID=3149227 RepID=UPI0032B46FDB
MANVVKDSGEGRFFLLPAGAREQKKKVVLEPLASALGAGLFYINDIITSLQKPKNNIKAL